MKELYQDKIDRYIKDEMSKDEKLAFEEELASDQELKEQYEFTKNVKQGISDLNSKMEILDNLDKQYNSEKDNTKKKKVYIWSSIISIAAIAIFAFILFPPEETKNVVESPVFNASIMDNIREGNNDLKEIGLKISTGQYAEALSMINEIEKKNMQYINEVKYSENQADIYEKEQLLLENEDLQWLKMYVYFGLKKYDDAIDLLNKIRHSKGTYKQSADSIYMMLFKDNADVSIYSPSFIKTKNKCSKCKCSGYWGYKHLNGTYEGNCSNSDGYVHTCGHSPMQHGLRKY